MLKKYQIIDNHTKTLHEIYATNEQQAFNQVALLILSKENPKKYGEFIFENENVNDFLRDIKDDLDLI